MSSAKHPSPALMAAETSSPEARAPRGRGRRLTDCDPVLVRYGTESLLHVSTLEEADGLLLYSCPCGAGHALLCWRRGRVPADAEPGPGRWDFSGSDLHDLTLSPSVNLGCWHGFVRNGEVTPC